MSAMSELHMDVQAAEARLPADADVHDTDMYFPRIEIRGAIAALDHYRHNYAILPLLVNLIAYRDRGEYVGGFLTALLSGDYAEAMCRADDTNLWLMPIYASFLYNEMPGKAHGSPESVATWQALKREVA